MKSRLFLEKYILLLLIFCGIINSCSSEFEEDMIQPEKPQDISLNESVGSENESSLPVADSANLEDQTLTNNENLLDKSQTKQQEILEPSSATTHSLNNQDTRIIKRKTIDQNLVSVKNFLKVKPITYTINSSKDTLLVCDKGTRIFFPKNCFVFEDGENPHSPVEINIKECYEFADFIGENLTTSSNGQMLETGGMINLTAEANGKPLQVKSDESYTIYFPKKDSTKEMEFFYGTHDETDFIDWELADDQVDSTLNQTVGSRIPTPILTGGIPLPKACRMRISMHTSAIGNKEVEWKFKNQSGDVYSYFEETFDPPENLYQSMCGIGSTAVEYSMNFNENGKLSKLIPSRSFNKSCDSLVAEFIKSLPLMDMKSMADNPPNGTTFSLGFGTTTTLNRTAFAHNFEESENIDANVILGDVESWKLNTYVMSATKMGWINCDRFWNTEAPKSDVFVTINSEHETSTFLIFKGIKSMMNGTRGAQMNRHFFSKIPKNSEIKLIAIQYAAGQPQLCIKDANTSDKFIVLDRFKPFTLAALKNEINKVN